MLKSLFSIHHPYGNLVKILFEVPSPQKFVLVGGRVLQVWIMWGWQQCQAGEPDQSEFKYLTTLPHFHSIGTGRIPK